MQERLQRRVTFDQDALLYDQARPGYPEEMFNDIVTLSGISSTGRVLEIGSGTGQATLPMARRGYQILGIEMGANMAAVARHNLMDYPQVQILTSSFEDWSMEEASFDLALSATAFHWIDPAIAYKKTAQALKPTGSIALCWHIHVQSEASQGFFEAVQSIYQHEIPEQKKDFNPLPRPDEAADQIKEEIEQTGLFDTVHVRRYYWIVDYDTAGYIRLLSTYSDHLILEHQRRDRLFQAITELINTQFHGKITKGYMAILYVARRK